MKHGKSALDRLFVSYEFGKDNYGYPAEDRIRVDIDKKIRSVHQILNSNGAVVPGIGNRTG